MAACPEGDKLPLESALSDIFSVSRSVIREVLARLRANGVIVSRHGSGSYVQRKPAVDVLRLAPLGDMANVLRAYEYRVAMEDGGDMASGGAPYRDRSAASGGRSEGHAASA